MRIHTDRIVSLSAMVVGVGSLIIILYQTQLMREAQHASALPYLAIAVSSNDDGAYITLRNVGVGPALIEDVHVRYQGRELAGDPYDFYIGLKRTGFREYISVDKVMPGRLIPAGEGIRMLGAGGPARVPMLTELLRLFDIAEVPEAWYSGEKTTRSGPGKAVIDITYSSIYGDRWRISSDAIVPEEL
jgi:hypothetical protein